MRLRYFLTALILLAFALPVGAAETAFAKAGGLSCFSINPADTHKDEAATATPAAYPSCDELCAKKNAACTATTGNHNPPLSCASINYDPSSTLCRCCALAE